MKTLLFLVLVLALINYVYSVCCPWVLENAKCVCEDGSHVAPWECCSYGACNVFCCNCGGECKHNKSDVATDELFSSQQIKYPVIEIITNRRRKRNAAENGGIMPISELEQQKMMTTWYFIQIDKNADLAIDHSEAKTHLEKLNKEIPPHLEMMEDGDYPEWFTLMDTDGNGLIEPSEFDRDISKKFIEESFDTEIDF